MTTNNGLRRADVGQNIRINADTVIAGSVRLSRRVRMLRRFPGSLVTRAEPTHKLSQTGNIATARLVEL